MTARFHPLLLAKLCLFQATFLVGSTACHGQQEQDRKPAAVQRKEAGRLPKVPTVESMLRPDASIERFLSRTPTESAYEKASSQMGSRSRTTEDELPLGNLDRPKISVPLLSINCKLTKGRFIGWLDLS